MSGTPPSEAVTLRGERCLLRAFRPDELDALLAARRASESLRATGGRGRRERDRLRRRIATSGRLHNGWLEFAIEVAGTLVGEVQARGGQRMMPPGTYELGIELYAAERRGRGVGTEAVALITTHLFATLGAGRVQATTDVANAAMRAVLARLGFVEEGVLRGFMPDNEEGGPRHDYVMAGVTAAEWAARQPKQPGARRGATTGGDVRSAAGRRLPSGYSTVTVFARLRGWSTFSPRVRAMR